MKKSILIIKLVILICFFIRNANGGETQISVVSGSAFSTPAEDGSIYLFWEANFVNLSRQLTNSKEIYKDFNHAANVCNPYFAYVPGGNFVSIDEMYIHENRENRILRGGYSASEETFSGLQNVMNENTTTFVIPGDFTFTVPENVYWIKVQLWGGGGSGGTVVQPLGSGGGGGGAYSSSTLAVSPGQSFTVRVGQGGGFYQDGGDSWFGSATTVMAKGGKYAPGNSSIAGIGGSAAAGFGAIRFSGGDGAAGTSNSSGGGGSSAGIYANGNSAIDFWGAAAPEGGGLGGPGRNNHSGNGDNGYPPGGGGGGALKMEYDLNYYEGGNGANGKVIISWEAGCSTPPPTAEAQWFCNGINQPAVSDLMVTALTGATINWYDVAEGGSPLAGSTTLATGIYYVSQTLNDCESARSEVFVTVYETPPAPSAGSNSPVCAGSVLNLTATTIENATYLWTGPNDFTSSEQNPSINGVSLAAGGTYSVTATVNGCNSAAANTSVTVNAIPPAPVAESNSPVCVASVLNLTATTIDNATYLWTGPNDFTSSEQNPSIVDVTTAVAGTYSVTATVNGCTSAAGNTVVELLSLPEAATTPTPFNGDVNVCYAGDEAITSITWAPAGDVTSWDVYFGAGSLPSEVTASVTTNSWNTGPLSANTTYYWKVVPKNNCGAATSATTWTFTTKGTPCCTFPTLSGASLAAANVCHGSGAQVNLTGMLPSKTFTLEYTIDGEGQTPVAALVSNASGNAGFTTRNLTSDDHLKTLMITGLTDTETNCSKVFSTSLTLNVVPLPTATLDNLTTTICHGETVTLTGSVTATGNWILGITGDISGAVTVSGSGSGPFEKTVTPPILSTTYTIMSILYNDYRCTSFTGFSGQANVTADQRPNLVVHNPEAVMAPNTIDLTVPAVTSGSSLPSGTVLSYWKDDVQLTAEQAKAVSVSGTYTIRAVRGACNVSANVEVIITDPVLSPGPISGPEIVCAGQAGVVYSVDEVTGATSYNWTLPEGAVFTAGANTRSITVTFGNLSGTISVSASFPSGTTDSSSKEITINPSFTPAVTITSDKPDKKICEGEMVTFTAIPAQTGGGTVSYQWKRDNTLVGGNDGTYSTDDLNNGEIIICMITVTGGTCLTTTTAVSNTVQVTVKPTRVYVTVTGAGLMDGSSWANAYNGDNLQTAINSVCGEVWVAAGTYKPTTGTDRTISFVMKNNVAIYGGFPNTGNPTWDDRDWAANETILSGDIGIQGDNSDNSYTVVVASNTDATAVIDGFTITLGNANEIVNNQSSDPDNSGGGMYNSNGSPTISNCIFLGNYASWEGGGLFNKGDNFSLIINNCSFIGNYAVSSGGAMVNDGPNHSVTMINCNFIGNYSHNGSALFNSRGSQKVFNCSFSGNSSVYNNDIFNILFSSISISNSIIWGNKGGIRGFLYPSITVTNSIVQGGYDGVGNLDVDPMFVSQPPIGLGTTGDLRLQPCSPAINAGSNVALPEGITTDLDGNPRFYYNNGIIDMGAYEFQGEKHINPTDGGVIASSHTICYGAVPEPFTSTSAPVGYIGNLEYQWQISTSSPTFADIPGAVSDSYTHTGTLTQTTWFRRRAKVTCEKNWVESNVVAITVFDEFTSGEIFATGQTICYNGDPAPIGSATAASGGDNVITYKWQANGSDIANSNSATYDPPPGLTATTTYTRWAKDGTCNEFTLSDGSWVVTVRPQFTAGAIQLTGETICYNGDPAPIGSATVASGGDNVITYKWQANGYDIANSNVASYDPPAGLTATTIYTRWAKDGTCNDYTQSDGSWVVTVNQLPVITPSASSVMVQYSDWVDIFISVTDDGITTPLTVSTKFNANGGAFAPGLPTGLTWLNPSEGVWNITGVADVAPGMYIITIEAHDGQCSSERNITLTVKQEDAITTYTGQEFVGEQNPSATTTPLILSASVIDADDGFRGDIRYARVQFYDVNTLAPLSGWLTPGLVTPGDLTQGLVTHVWNAPVPSSGYNTFTIGVKVGTQNPEGNGYYVGSDKAVVNVFRTDLYEFITGGGHIVPTDSKGTFASDPGRKLNFGFNIKWNKTMKNLQGSLNLIFRIGDKVYQIRTNAMSSLSINSVNPCSQQAVFTSKANLTDVTLPGLPVALKGNLNLQVTMTSNTSPGVVSTIGFTVYEGNTLLYSSSWPVNKTEELPVEGGNLIVHNGIKCITNNEVEVMLYSSKNPSFVGEEVIFKAVVTPKGSTLVPAGTIQFKEGTALLGEVTMNNGMASLALSNLAEGTHPVTAFYVSTNDFKNGTSNTVSQQVIDAMLDLVSDNNPSKEGEKVKFTATVSASASADVSTGMVTFKRGDTEMGTITLSGGVAVYETDALPAGVHVITAGYSGDIHYSPLTASLTQTVNSNSTITLVSSKNPEQVNNRVTFTATVSGLGGARAGADILFYINGSLRGTVVTDVNGKAAWNHTFTSTGTFVVEARIAGQSASLSQIIRNKVKSAEIVAVAGKFELKVYPNPFSDRLRFEFVSPVDNQVRIDIFDLSGRRIETVFDNRVKAGVNYQAVLIPDRIISGVYLYRLTMGDQVYNGKVLFNRE